MTNSYENQGPGQDSFLDIVANLVGILIILVVVVGAQAGEAVMQNRQTDSKEELESASHQLEIAEGRYAMAAESQQKLEKLREIEDYNSSIENQRRNQLLLMIEDKRRQLEAAANPPDETAQKRLQQQQVITQLKKELALVQDQVNTLSSIKTASKSIEHIPTPIAKTVFNDEIHFRLLNKKIAYVPLDALIDRMRDEWEIKAQSLKANSSTFETVGPIDGFYMKYTLESFNQRFDSPYGPIDRQVRQFNRFELITEAREIGHSIEEALVEGSTLSQRIRRLEPQKHTISIWVYPDSYSEYNQLKQWLNERGFQIACWPIPEGKPISGGPNGQRSVAQ
jgi:hypothetical protein